MVKITFKEWEEKTIDRFVNGVPCMTCVSFCRRCRASEGMYEYKGFEGYRGWDFCPKCLKLMKKHFPLERSHAL